MISALPRLFFVIVSFFGALSVFLLPPVQAADEDSHLIRSVMVARGDLSVREEGGRFGQDVPASLVSYVNSHRALMGHSEAKYGYGRWYGDSHQLAAYGPTEFTPYSAQAASPLLYLPQAAGIWVAKIVAKISPTQPVGFSWAAANYGARLGNLCAFILMGCVSLAYANRYRLVVFAALTLPMVIHQAGSSSYDASTIAVAIGFFSLLTGLLERQRAPGRLEVALLLLCAFMLGHSKAAYAPLLLSALLLQRVMPFSHFVRLIAAMLTLAVFGFLLTVLIFGVPNDDALQIKFSEQLTWLTSHFWDIPSLLVRSLEANKGFLTISFLANFGWLDTNWSLPALVFPVLAMATAIAGDALNGPGLFRLRDAAVIVVGISLAVTAFHLAMYVYWTSIIQADGIGASIVNGVQGRYFLPLTPFCLGLVAVLPSFVRDRATVGLREDIALSHVVLVGLGLSLTLFALLVRYWIPNPT